MAVNRRPSAPPPTSTSLKTTTHGAAVPKASCPTFGDGTAVLIRVECNPGSDLLASTHTFLGAFCESNFRPNVAQRLTGAGYELLENGLQYGGIRSKVVLELLQYRRDLAIRVSNEAILARTTMLREHLARIEVNPEAVFLEELKRSMAGGGQRAMLGLARVAHEARLKLFAEIRDQKVVVTALYTE